MTDDRPDHTGAPEGLSPYGVVQATPTYTTRAKRDEKIRLQQAHMDRVRAVQRRSAYERVINKIGAVRAMAPLTDEEGGQMKYLVELRDIIRKELIENGQLES